MIQAMEGHLAAWAQQEIQALSAESELFGHVRKVAGGLDLPPGPPLGATEVAALVQVQSLAPQPQNRDLGPPPVTAGAALHLNARIHLRLLGRQQPYVPADGWELSPGEAAVHRVDLAAFTLLALLRERPGPRPDGPVIPLLELTQGAQPAGAAAVAQGTRRAHLAWTGWEVGSIQILPVNSEALRQWDIELTAACQFRLSPAALEGGRILATLGQVTVQNKPLATQQASLYAPAESLSLAWFEGVSEALVAELGDHAITTLGDLGRLGPTRVAALAGELRTATHADEVLLGQLTTIAIGRQTALELNRLYQLEPAAFALPVRALLEPTPDESLLLSQLITSPEIHAQVAMLALPVTVALRADRRSQVRLGTLLIRRE